MRQFLICSLFLFVFTSITAQQSRTTNPKFEQKIDGLLSETVPFVYVADLAKKDMSETVLLDAREWDEYNLSHIPDAHYIGYDEPSFTAVSDLDKDSEIIVYCSIGYRSEKIAERLKDMGYTNVWNLYGSIFEWVNQGNQIENNQGEQTKKIHTYSKRWSRWMINQSFESVW